MMWKILLAIVIFADANIAYFEILRLIQFFRNYRSRKVTSLSDGGGATAPKTDFSI
jgi:hypothetical protein